MLTRKDLERLRWRCRRGMLELDLVLTAFLDQYADTLATNELEQLQQLLEYPDNDLWELVMARREPEDDALKPLLVMLRTGGI